MSQLMNDSKTISNSTSSAKDDKIISLQIFNFKTYNLRCIISDIPTCMNAIFEMIGVNCETEKKALERNLKTVQVAVTVRERR